VALAVGALTTCAWVTPAWSCGAYYAVEMPQQPAPKPKARPKPTPDMAMGIAEASIPAEDPGKAAAALAEAFPGLRTTPMDASRQQLKALHLMAVALARVDGALSVPGAFYADGPKTRAANLEWSIAALRRLNEQRANDPVLQAELGEALARVPAHQDEALAILGALAAKDLMGSAHGYAELARLRAQKGDAGPSREAAVRCRAMTRSPAVCPATLPDAPVATKVALNGA